MLHSVTESEGSASSKGRSSGIGNGITKSKSATVFELYVFQLPVASKGRSSNGGTGVACPMYDVFPTDVST